jgi:polysaccharide export outer membrane protein
MTVRKILVALPLFLLLAAHAITANQQPPIWVEYRIGPEDVLTISVWGNAELTRTVQVRPDGKFSLPLINDMQASGLTPMELRQQLEERLREYVASPEVSVMVDEVRSFKISILGKVNGPGRYELKSATTALEALALAGGFREDEFSSPDELIVLRHKGEAMERIRIPYSTAITAAGRPVNIFLQPGDLVVVP